MSGVVSMLPDCAWAEDAVTLYEFIKHKDAPVLPKVARFTCGERIATGSLVDWEQPFLVYSHRRRTKIYAENLTWKNDSKSFVTQGYPLEIAKDYPGTCNS